MLGKSGKESWTAAVKIDNMEFTATGPTREEALKKLDKKINALYNIAKVDIGDKVRLAVQNVTYTQN